MLELFHDLEENDINYLHFKSNTNLDASFQNKADFDVLVDKNRITDIERIISDNGGKRHNPLHIGSYPGVDNWIVFDENDGNLYHLHLHYQLATGKALVKDYVLPWNELLFSTRVKDPQYGIYITDPNLELLMLATRSVLKAKPLDYLKKCLGIYGISHPMKVEWDDLYNKSTEEPLNHYIKQLYPNHYETIRNCLFKAKLTVGDYRKLHRAVRTEMRIHRRYSSMIAMLKFWLYRFEDLSHKVISRKMDGISITKKTSLQGGLIIAFIGVDGAGKSTVSNEIQKWIGRKIECKRFYMGTGDGRTTLFVSLLKGLRNKVEHESVASDDLHNSNSHKGKTPLSLFKNPKQYIKKYIKLCMISSVEKNNVKKIKKMHRYRLNGGISVLDRFPQFEMAGQNDGPKVPGYVDVFGEKSFIKRRIGKEAERLSIVKEIKPNLIFRLNISVDTCISRKPENRNRDVFEKKIRDLNQLKFQGAKIIDIDAEQPYEKELLEIKKHLWLYI